MRPYLLVVAACCFSAQPASAENYTVDVWADNWFQFRINGETVAEDSVPITTERSFNAERFEFQSSPPFTIGLVAKDFKENDTGLEYIGTRRQQMGDGGVIVQITNSGGDAVAVTDSAWRCLTVHQAPMDKQCARESNPVAGQGPCTFQETDPPINWDKPDFNDSHWPQAKVYAEQQVRPKDGYDRVSWHRQAQLIWGPDLETTNTLLCRFTVD